MIGIYVNATRRVLDYGFFFWHRRRRKKPQECDIFHHLDIFQNRFSVSQRYFYVFPQEPLEVIIAKSTVQSHPWHALSDNVEEMEISCSNKDENEFAAVISSATFPHRRGEYA